MDSRAVKSEMGADGGRQPERSGLSVPLLEARGLCRSFGRKRVLEDFSLQLFPGEMAALSGANGSGKSTLMKLLAGLLKPDRGEILYGGKAIPPGSAALSRMLAYLPQENPLMPGLSVRDNLALFSGRREGVSEEFIRAFALEGLMQVRVKKLSGGMQRRVAFLASCCMGQPVFLLDEPTASLDLEQKAVMRGWMKKHRDRGGALLVATHDEKEIAACDRVIRL